MKLNQIFLIAVILALTPLAHGQTLEVLHSFDGSDGQHPRGSMLLASNGYFYGSTAERLIETNVYSGIIFQISPDGEMTTFALAPFGGVGNKMVEGPDGEFYGTSPGPIVSANGGIAEYGTVFKITTDGELTTLFEFEGTNGAYPEGGVILGMDGNFYGTTSRGGTNDEGTIFKITFDGVLTTLASIIGLPIAPITQAKDGNFYGITGVFSHGNVFRLTTNGVLQTVAFFNGRNGVISFQGLVQGTDGLFYGTSGVSSSGFGTVFRVNPKGSIRRLVSFNGKNGQQPESALIQGSDGNFYGTTHGGTNNMGTVFKMTRAGTLTTLLTFVGTNGASPMAELIEGKNGYLYGTTYSGGASNLGTVFRLLYPPLFAGVYSRVVSVEETNAVPFTIKITSKMKFAGKMFLNGLKYPLIGQFPTNSFSVHTTTKRRGETPLDVNFSLVATNGNFQLVGTVSNSFLNMPLLGDRTSLK